MYKSITQFLFVIPAAGFIGYLAVQFLEPGGLAISDWISLSEGRKCLSVLQNGDWHLAWPHLSRIVTIEGHIMATLFLATLFGIRHCFSYSEKQSLATARKLQDLHSKANHLGNKGLECSESGQFEKAINYYGQALDISNDIGDPKVAATTLGNLGNVFQAMGNIKNAIGYHKQALSIFREIGDSHGEASVLGNLGKTYIAFGQLEKAITYNRQSLSIFEKINSPYAPQMRIWVSELENQAKPTRA